MGNGEKLDARSWPEKGKRIVDICHNVRFTPTSMCTILYNADTFT